MLLVELLPLLVPLALGLLSALSGDTSDSISLSGVPGGEIVERGFETSVTGSNSSTIRGRLPEVSTLD